MLHIYICNLDPWIVSHLQKEKGPKFNQLKFPHYFLFNNVHFKKFFFGTNFFEIIIF